MSDAGVHTTKSETVLLQLDSNLVLPKTLSTIHIVVVCECQTAASIVVHTKTMPCR